MQMTGGPHGRGSEDGTRLSIPSFSSWPFVPIVQTSRFLAVQAITAEFLGTPLGYLGCVYFGPDDATSWRDHWQQVWTDWGFDRYENEHGQDAISVMDDTLSPDDGVLLREYIELDGVEDAGAVHSSTRSRISSGIRPGGIRSKTSTDLARSRFATPSPSGNTANGGEAVRRRSRVTDTRTTRRRRAMPRRAISPTGAIGPSYPAVVGTSGTDDSDRARDANPHPA